LAASAPIANDKSRGCERPGRFKNEEKSRSGCNEGGKDRESENAFEAGPSSLRSLGMTTKQVGGNSGRMRCSATHARFLIKRSVLREHRYLSRGQTQAAVRRCEMTLRELMQRATSSKYTRALEGEVARLRGENRALLNSILGIAGVPPIVVAENDVSPAAGLKLAEGKATANVSAASAPARAKSVMPRSGAPASANEKTAPAMRRRSWHQIYRMLEINSARKKEASEIL
jgi:hypothetical protein